jgi:nitrite reductase (NO-forming)
MAAAAELPVEKAVLTEPPNVPPPITRKTPAKVVVELEVQEKTGQLADGVEYTFWTFGGTTPGRFIRVRVGDTVEFHLANHQHNKLPHNIDLHAVTGPGGGATSTFTAPGHQSKFTFKVLNPGLYVYHCATAPIGMHIGNGMYGLIYVQGEEPLPKVDHEYYLMQGDFYTDADFGVKGHQPFSMKRAIDENASYVVFNGSALSLIGENALKAKVGDRLRLFVGVGGPNLASSFHLIGTIFDRVYEGGTKAQENVQTTLIPPGGASIVELRVPVEGNFVLVDHSIIRAFNKGAMGILKVEGKGNPEIYSGKQDYQPYFGDESVASQLSAKKGPAAPPSAPTADGKTLFLSNCAMCHQSEGQGLPGAFPPLAKSDFLAKLNSSKQGRQELVTSVLKGRTGKITVNGRDFNGVMTPVSGLNDSQMAAVLTFVSGQWGNQGSPFSEREVKEAREANLPAPGAGQTTE